MMKFLKIFYLLLVLQTVATFSSEKPKEVGFPQLAARLTPARYPQPPKEHRHSSSSHHHHHHHREHKHHHHREKTFQKIGQVIVGVSHHTHNDLVRLHKMSREHEDKIAKQTYKLDLAIREADILAAHMQHHADRLHRAKEKAAEKIAAILIKD